MGLFRRIVYANLVPERIRDAAKIDELKKQNELLKKQMKQEEKAHREEIRMSGTMLDEIRYARRRDEV